jgi:hypothetical protein
MDPYLRAFVQRLISSASVGVPPNTVDVGPILELDLRDGFLIVSFVAGVDMRFALNGTAWAALLSWMLHGEKFEPGTTDVEAYRRLAEIVGAVPTPERFDA